MADRGDRRHNSPKMDEGDKRPNISWSAPAIDDMKAPLLAALGAADLALATVNDLLVELRERAEETRSDTRSRVEQSRARLTRLQEDLPEQLGELRERFTADELRSAAEGYVEAATSRYNELAERGEAALERLRGQAGFEDASARAEGYVDQAVELTQEALRGAASQTRAVGERAAKLVGIELPKKAPAKKVPAKKATARKATARKATARKATARKAPAEARLGDRGCRASDEFAPKRDRWECQIWRLSGRECLRHAKLRTILEDCRRLPVASVGATRSVQSRSKTVTEPHQVDSNQPPPSPPPPPPTVSATPPSKHLFTYEEVRGAKDEGIERRDLRP